MESLGFEWDNLSAVWEERLKELADYRKIRALQCSSNLQRKHPVGWWHKGQYKVAPEGRHRPHHLRIQELESLGFEWDSLGAAWDDV
jgi:hypothetical protein